MTNPAPRPALRKAPDADVHPATQQTPQEVDLRNRQANTRLRESAPTQPASLDRQKQVITLPATSPEADDQPADISKKSSRKSSPKKKSDKSKAKKQDKKEDKQDKKKGKGKDKGKNKGKGKKSSGASNRIDLRAKVPTSVRRTLRSSAKARGTSVEGNVDAVLTGMRPDLSN